MDIIQKLGILGDAAKYDVACTSSGVQRSGKLGSLGAASNAGCCHSFTSDGRCVSLLKVLMTNECVFDCAYCINRKSNSEIQRTSFTPQELADLTIGFYRRNYIEGLFLSSGVTESPDRTLELMTQSITILREAYGFRGYIHAKVVPGCSQELVERLGFLCDRLSVNLELPSSESLAKLCPQKSAKTVLRPMGSISQGIAESRESMALAKRRTQVHMSKSRPTKKSRQFAPAGQSTQMIIGATPETDYQILGLSASLYKKYSLKRVFFSAYIPVVQDPRLPSTSAIQLDREHRLYQADWLLRFYGFDVNEIIDEEHPFLERGVDPKTNWALNNLDLFPVEVNTCPYDMLLRVPGIGVKGAKRIVQARKHAALGEAQLKKLGIAYKRARYFITCKGTYCGSGIDFSRSGLLALMAKPIDGGQHGRRSGKLTDGQLSLFDDTAQLPSTPVAKLKAPALLTPAPTTIARAV